MTAEDVPQRVMTAWFRANITGCRFATMFAKPLGEDEARGTIRVHAIYQAAEMSAGQICSRVDPLLTEAATHPDAVVLTFPDVRSEHQVADIINSLCAGSGLWSCREVQWRDFPRSDILLAVEWKTPRGHISTTLGLAPFGTMPLTRRAPYVCIALWPGGHENPHWPAKGPRVSLADMPHNLEFEAHQKMKADSEEHKRDYLDKLSEGAADHRVSFCLSPTIRDRLTSCAFI
jgi:hypothetical protein